MERQVTIPLEIVMRSVPRVEKIRSRTIFGLSIVEVLFEEGVENYWARQRVKEKLDEATLPDGVKPDLGRRWPRPTARSIATSWCPTAPTT